MFNEKLNQRFKEHEIGVLLFCSMGHGSSEKLQYAKSLRDNKFNYLTLDNEITYRAAKNGPNNFIDTLRLNQLV